MIGVGSIANHLRELAEKYETAAFIVDMLKNETTEQEIVDAMCREYNAPREVLAADVAEALAKLREINALEE